MLRPRNAFRERDAGVVAGNNNRPKQQIEDRHFAAERGIHSRNAGWLPSPAPCVFANRELVFGLQASVSNRVEHEFGCHELRHARWTHQLICILLKEHSAISLDQDGERRGTLYFGSGVPGHGGPIWLAKRGNDSLELGAIQSTRTTVFETASMGDHCTTYEP